MIDEKKLIEDFKNTFSDSVLNQTFGFGKYTLLEAVEEIINRQPQVETDTNVGSKWIPCEERLPIIEEEPSEYGSDIGKRFWITDSEGYVCESVFWKNANKFDDDAIAWQPLPAPYKKEGAENECN